MSIPPPPASNAGRVEAKRSAPSTSARYSGLIPSRSRPSTTRPDAVLDDRKREHADQVIGKALGAPVVKGLQDHLGVRASSGTR